MMNSLKYILRASLLLLIALPSILIASELDSLKSVANEEYDSFGTVPFISTWKTDNTGSSADNQITIPTTGTGYNYTVNWEDVTDASINGTAGSFTGNATITFPTAGTYQVSITGSFPRIYFNNAGDKDKLLRVDQWGDNSWTSMQYAFYGCTSLRITASDAPNLSGVKNMSSAFRNNTVLNDPMDHWDVSKVTNMANLFYGAAAFNQDLGSWNVSKVTNMASMFRGTAFNQDIGSWNVAKVKNMASMFFDAGSFNQPLDSWNVGLVTNMSSMFRGASNFNQNISGWNTSSVTKMASLFFNASAFNGELNGWNTSGVTTMANAFRGASIFNQPLDQWDVSSVSSMSQMFREASNFNQDLSSWNTSNVTNMASLFFNASAFDDELNGWNTSAVTTMANTFRGASNFNHPLDQWDVGAVTSMSQMFRDAASFDQDISGWDVSNVTVMTNALRFSGLSSYSYDQLLTGWSSLPSLQSGVSLGANGLSYCSSEGRNKLINDYGWTITGDSQTSDCSPPSSFTAFISTWKTDNSGTSASNEITIPTIGSGYNFTVSWIEEGNPANYGVAGPFIGDATITFPSAGVYEVAISGSFPRIHFNNAGDRQKILTINQWGANVWTSMERSFMGCSNLTILAEDAPDLTGVTSMSYMFSNATSLNDDISNWDISGIGDMSHMFDGSGLTQFLYEYLLDSWSLLANPPQNITLGTLGLAYCEEEARSTLINTYGWTIIGDVKPAACEGAFITTWKTDNPGTSASNEITIPTTGTGYDYTVNWIEVGNRLNHGTAGPFNGNATISFPTEGTYEVRITGFFPRIFFDFSDDREKILTVEQWGDISWLSMQRAFSGCSYLTIPAIDAPDLSNVTDMSFMFQYAENFNQNINHWDVGNITNMTGLFLVTRFFNQDLSNWDVSNVTVMSSMFQNSGNFNQNIGTWNVSNVTDMSNMFESAIHFNQPIGNWDVSNLTDMHNMFRKAHAFNQDIGGWNTSAVTNMARTFAEVRDFNQPLDQWNVGLVADMSYMFYDASNFNHGLGAWDVSSVTNMNAMFREANQFDQDISSWDVSNVTVMTSMFRNASAFNQDISSWNVSNVTYTNSMFFGANSFDQSLAGWDISNADLISLPSSVSAYNYNETLIAWSNLPNPPAHFSLHATGLSYCSIEARNTLVNTYNWTITGDSQTTDCSPPPVELPTEVVAVASDSSVTVNWTDNAVNETGYEIERSDDGGQTYVLIATASVDSEQYEDTAAPFGDLIYRVRAVNASNSNSSDYQEVEVTFSEPEPDPEPINTNLSHQPVYNGNISAIRWQGANDAEEQVYTFAYDGLNRLSQAQYATKSGATYTSNQGHYSVPNIGYDLNGNITNLTRQGLNTSNNQDIIDELEYEYGVGTSHHGNQLHGVSDTRGSAGFKDGNKSGDDYAYDSNGNMTQDLNKEISKIEYNHLNLPIKVTFQNAGDSITYSYDAAGIKLQQKVYKEGDLVKTTDYVGGFIYETDTSDVRELQLVQHEEGRIIPEDGNWDYQYHLKDHLGNVRVTFSTTQENYERTATFEDANLAVESEDFGNVDTPNRVTHPLSSNTGKTARLNSASPAGPFAVLSVNKGDTVNMSVNGYYSGGTGYSNALDSAAMVGALSTAFGSSKVLGDGGVTSSQVENGLAAAIMVMGVGGSSDDNVPGAYLNYILFDKDMNLVRDESDLLVAGFAQISSAANGSEETISLSDRVIEQEGYLIAYLSNESNADPSQYVYFDDFTIYHGKTNVVSTQDYYPFGLTFNSYERTASTKNRFKFNGIERVDELGLNWDLAEYRSYDPAIGRWGQIDPKLNFFESPYTGFGNNSILYSDPLGDTINVSNLSQAQLDAYNSQLEFLMKSELFATYFKQLQESETTYTISAGKGEEGTPSAVGQFFNPNTNEVGVGEGVNAYAVAQELFHAFQSDGEFYKNDKPSPLSTIETEGDVASIYIMGEVGGLIPMHGDWSQDILFDSFDGTPSLEKIQSEGYQEMFQRAVDDRIEYYKGTGLNAPTYTAPNTGVKPKALENLIKRVSNNKK